METKIAFLIITELKENKEMNQNYSIYGEGFRNSLYVFIF